MCCITCLWFGPLECRPRDVWCAWHHRLRVLRHCVPELVERRCVDTRCWAYRPSHDGRDCCLELLVAGRARFNSVWLVEQGVHWITPAVGGCGRELRALCFEIFIPAHAALCMASDSWRRSSTSSGKARSVSLIFSPPLPFALLAMWASILRDRPMMPFCL